MTMLHALIAQVQTAPDDDAPRLACANTVGGERGELVLVQFRITSGVATKRDEWRRLHARERELLVARQSGGPLPRFANQMETISTRPRLEWKR